jgi:acyl carrier protein
MQPTHQAISSALLAYLSETFLEPGAELNEDVPLKELGLDSFGMLELTLFLERTFHVPFPLRALTQDTSHSVRTLAGAYLEAGVLNGPDETKA